MLALLAAFVVVCLLFLSKPCARDMRLFLATLFQQFALSLLGFLAGLRLLGGVAAASAASETMPLMPSFKRKRAAATVENVEEATAAATEPSVLDLPELAIDCILERLPPAELRSMGAVCRSMRERCRGDHLWKRHMSEKWGRVLGRAARDEWRAHLASASESGGASSVSAGGSKRRRWLAALSCVCPVVSWMRPRPDSGKSSGPALDDSIMSWYLSMESGKFWFPAQVYNREHGHVGFMMSCYDAELSYDYHTDSFRARYPPHGRRTVVLEDGVQWDRIRAPPVDTLAHDLHASDCLHELRPGDHIEIQWRRNKEFPYGWWYGAVGHLESCDGNEHFCRCHLSDTVLLEFNQYTPGSRWRQALVNRKDHREEGNEGDGFYGGIRKLRSKDDISKWRQLWPTDILE
ncbi:hypothetical protein HU200_056864 [Digitaria exilis]|uniref:F-box domain-containing protein n=1 Tax=Digitaria exilis TaxID=1010633 RepID=A0A835ACJ3_9POAL|nr:hypothetical protein HU200_056864 [Digitaria exilis]